MKTSSAKAKGRRLCQAVAEKLLTWAPDLKPDDIYVTPSGVTGEDLKLSPAAREIYPYAVECKNQESLNIWSALEQSRTHVKNPDVTPLVVFTRNREGREYVALELEHFLKLTR
jgi:hypothetical protein